MPIKDEARRRFLKTAGAGFAGGALIGLPGRADASDDGEPKLFYDVRGFGAAGDGKMLDTAAINRAIDEAAAAGGGTVYSRAGNYLCYSIHLKSRVAVYLDQGATILAAESAADAEKSYDLAESNKPWQEYQDYGHNHWHNSLIWARV